MQENGTTHIDIKEELVDFKENILTNRLGTQIIQHLGEAVDIIPTLDIKFDLFIDADKENYINYFNIILPK
jgi:predicted O-methyltransferase YrrM